MENIRTCTFFKQGFFGPSFLDNCLEKKNHLGHGYFEVRNLNKLNLHLTNTASSELQVNKTMLTVPTADSVSQETVIRCTGAISPMLKVLQGEDVTVCSMFPVAAGDQYKWPLLAVLSHAEQPNESAGGLKNPPLSRPAPTTRFSPSNSISLSNSITQFKTKEHS